jgi:glycosyltransferase involved in cell wall biosynthesis
MSSFKSRAWPPLKRERPRKRDGIAMRILQIMTSKANGGAETYACDVMLKLHEAGVDQCVVMSEDAQRFPELKARGLRMAPFPLRVPFAAAQRLLLSRLSAHEKPAIAQTWMRRAASLAPKTPTPVIGWFGGYYDPRHFRSCQHIVGVTRDIVTHMVDRGVPPDRAHYIPTFPTISPSPALDRAELTTPAGAKVLLTLSRLHEKKGLDTLLHALKGLPNCFAWLAGDGPLQGQLEKLAVELGIKERVRFLGWRSDRSALLRAADVCVLPSRYEPFGNVILEAWAARTPLVACASAGPAAHVTDGVNGLLTPINDAEALRGAIERVLAEDSLRTTLISNGREAYERNFTPEAVTAQWLSFYEQVLERSATSRSNWNDFAA